MLSCTDIKFAFSQHAFDFSLYAQSGARLALRGPSGIGKTTILNLIAGILRPHSGQIKFNDQSFSSTIIDKRPLAYLFQYHHVFDHLTACENIALGVYSVSKENRKNQKLVMNDIISDCHLHDIIQQKTATLSGGQKQRVALARVMTQGQKLWLLDEPFNGLDNESKNLMMIALTNWQYMMGATIIFTSHHDHDRASFATQEVQVFHNMENMIQIKQSV